MYSFIYALDQKTHAFIDIHRGQNDKATICNQVMTSEFNCEREGINFAQSEQCGSLQQVTANKAAEASGGGAHNANSPAKIKASLSPICQRVPARHGLSQRIHLAGHRRDPVCIKKNKKSISIETNSCAQAAEIRRVIKAMKLTRCNEFVLTRSTHLVKLATAPFLSLR